MQSLALLQLPIQKLNEKKVVKKQKWLTARHKRKATYNYLHIFILCFKNKSFVFFLI